MSRVYVGNLPQDIRQRDVEDLFFKFGRIVEIDLKIPSRGPALAFVTFESWKDAEDAVKGRDGVEYEGSRLRVEVIRDGSGSRGGGRERGRADERGREPGRSGGYRGGADSDWAGGSSGMGGGGGYAERGYGDRGYSERGYGDRGYAGSDRGYDRGFPQRSLSALFLPVHSDTETQRLFCSFSAPVTVDCKPFKGALGLKGVGSSVRAACTQQVLTCRRRSSDMG